MPAKITREFLVGAGISESVLARVYSTIRFLNLIDPDDSPTDTLRELASGTAQDYHRLLEQAIRIAYADDLQNINPATDSQLQIKNVFQKYTLKSQHDRQVALLLGLC